MLNVTRGEGRAYRCGPRASGSSTGCCSADPPAPKPRGLVARVRWRGANGVAGLTLDVELSSFSTFSRPLSPPHAIHPCEGDAGRAE
jgi:hypothetical protein